jgi:hypothetical protein
MPSVEMGQSQEQLTLRLDQRRSKDSTMIDVYWLTEWPGGDGRRALYSSRRRPVRPVYGVWFMQRLGELELSFPDKFTDFRVVEKDRVRDT